MLFADERLNFFRPLTGKYREQVTITLAYNLANQMSMRTRR